MADFDDLSRRGYSVIGVVLQSLNQADLLNVRQVNRTARIEWPETSRVLGAHCQSNELRNEVYPGRLPCDTSSPQDNVRLSHCPGADHGTTFGHAGGHDICELCLNKVLVTVEKDFVEEVVGFSVTPLCRDCAHAARARGGKIRSGVCSCSLKWLEDDQICDRCYMVCAQSTQDKLDEHREAKLTVCPTADSYLAYSQYMVGQEHGFVCRCGKEELWNDGRGRELTWQRDVLAVCLACDQVCEIPEGFNRLARDLDIPPGERDVAAEVQHLWSLPHPTDPHRRLIANRSNSPLFAIGGVIPGEQDGTVYWRPASSGEAATEQNAASRG